MAKLLFYRKNTELLRVNLTSAVTTVGRGSDNDVVVPDPAVSRRQFAIKKSGTVWRLTDSSGKRTDVGGKRVDQMVLVDGAEIRLAQWCAVFRSDPGDADAESTEAPGGGGTPNRVGGNEPGSIGPVELRVVSGGVEQVLALDGKRLTVGSGQGCSVRLGDQFVSWRHLSIEQSGPAEFRVEDLRSTNGTFLGRARVEAAQIPLDCSLRIGESELVVRRAVGAAEGAGRGVWFEGMISNEPAMHRVWEMIDRVAPSPMVVAIIGESGTGKELVARALHARSNRAAGPFSVINCSSLSKELAESELFGHEKGAFTGADSRHIGAFEASHKGTLFLDEVAELPMNVQAKLLRALESNEIRRVGASSAMHVDVRVVAATNKDLRTAVNQRGFREDLYWRLAIQLVLPPLRDRRGDVALLAQHFLDQVRPHGERLKLSTDAERRLLGYAWPGNVRELRNTVQRALLTRKGDHVEADDLLFDPRGITIETGEPSEDVPDPHVDDLDRIYIAGKKLDEVVDEVIAKTCMRLGPPAKVADALGVARTTVYRRLESQGLTPSDLVKDPKSSAE